MSQTTRKRRLLLVTDMFPYDAGESFLETELPYLCSAFDVTILSTAADTGTMRPVDTAVAVHHYVASTGISRYLETLGFAALFLITGTGLRECTAILRTRHKVLSRLRSSLAFFVASERFLLWLRREGILAQHKSGIFYSYWSNWKLLAILRRRSEFPNMNVLTRLHGYDLYQERYQDGRQPFKRFMDSRLDQVHFVSEFGMRYYMKAFQITQSSRHVLSRLGTQNSHGMGPYQRDGVFDLVSCSNVVPLKRIHLIIDALFLMDDIDIHWQHFGGGVDLQKMQDYARHKLHHKRNIRYTFHGAVSNYRVLEHYATNKVDCFITTTSTEGGNPVSIMEALSFGIPVVATAVGGVTEMLEESANPLLPANPISDELLVAVLSLAKMDIGELYELRKQCRLLWEKRFLALVNYSSFVARLKALMPPVIAQQK